VSGSAARRALKIHISGVVQGVGFRPYVYRLAVLKGVTGYIRNLGGSGVEIHVEGDSDRVGSFLDALTQEPPPRAKMESIQMGDAEPLGASDFRIIAGEPSIRYNAAIPPDLSICGECLAEVLGVSRWRSYPFHSCVNCGPRYSMIYKVPYERENTSMRDFPLCEQCLVEYSDPKFERRFHAQGISCPACGPRVWLSDAGGAIVSDGTDSIRQAAELIDEGAIVAVKGLGGFHVSCSATLDDALEKLRERKRRPTKPFAVMALNTHVLLELVEAPGWVLDVLGQPSRPIMLLDVRGGARVSPLVAPGLRKLGVFLPYTALHYLLLLHTRDKYAVMTSGNPHGEPMCVDNDEAYERLGGIVDYFLMHNRKIVNRVDDSVIRVTRGLLVTLRRGRGYAPLWTTLPFRSRRSVVAFGAMLQSAGAVAFQGKVVLTPFVGDVDDFKTFQDLEKSLSFLMESYSIRPEESLLVADLHPLYPSSRLAESWGEAYGSEVLRVQHHWAHIASVMAENRVVEEVVGVALDGVGYGADGRAWGGEVLLASFENFERIGHLKPQRMPSGDGAVEYPARMLLGILSDALNGDEVLRVLRGLRLIESGFRGGEREASFLLDQVRRGSPLTTSTGRVLDAVSAMLGLCVKRTYEGEPAIILEEHSTPTSERLSVRLASQDPPILDTTDIVLQALSLLESGHPHGEIAYMVQHSLGYGLGLIARRASSGHRYVALSGGAAVNEYIVEGISEALKGSGLNLLMARDVPPNDGGIALGQAAIAAWKIREDLQ